MALPCCTQCGVARPDPPVGRYGYHKLALAPLLSWPDSVLEEIAALSPSSKEGLFAFIRSNGLGPMWLQLLKQYPQFPIFNEELLQLFKRDSLELAARYLIQKHVLKTVAAIFNEKSIAHAVFKGAHIRELLYDSPSVRPAVDIDILIHPADVSESIEALTGIGFSLEVKEQNVSHEVTLYYKNVAVDLHWHILRPGRLRMSLTDEFLARRQNHQAHSGFDSETTVFIMLVHPVFTKYSTTSMASLVRFVDLLQWVEKQPIDWKNLLNMLSRYGVCTAAWITARYLYEITGKSLPDDFMLKIRPSFLKRIYLNIWIRYDLASKLMLYPFLIQIGLTLPAQDRFSDAVRFVKTLSAANMLAGKRKQELLAAKR